MIDEAALYERLLGGLEGFYAHMAANAPGAQVIRREGVFALVSSSCPHRSVFNGVTYRDAEALAAALEDLAQAYDRAGVLAWTVWTPAGDAPSRAALAAAGHVLDATPRAMAAPLDEIDTANGAAGLTWERSLDAGKMCALLEEVFHWEGAHTREAFSELPRAGQVYVAHLDGRPAACVATLDHEGDCVVWNVATVAAARGRGLASALMRQAVIDAGERGCQTTSLQATAAGRPIYERLGYRDLGPLEMWERRRASAGPT